MKKKLPQFRNDTELDKFIAHADLSEYLESADLKPSKFQVKHRDTSVTIRISSELLKVIKAFAHLDNIRYQKYIKLILEKYLYDKIRLLQRA